MKVNEIVVPDAVESAKAYAQKRKKVKDVLRSEPLTVSDNDEPKSEIRAWLDQRYKLGHGKRK